MENFEKQMNINNTDLFPLIFGHMDKNLKQIRDIFRVDILIRDNSLKILGYENDTLIVEKLIDEIINTILKDGNLTDLKFNYLLRHFAEGSQDRVSEYLNDIVTATATGKMIKPKTLGQKIYIDSI